MHARKRRIESTNQNQNRPTEKQFRKQNHLHREFHLTVASTILKFNICSNILPPITSTCLVSFPIFTFKARVIRSFKVRKYNSRDSVRDRFYFEIIELQKSERARAYTMYYASPKQVGQGSRVQNTGLDKGR